LRKRGCKGRKVEKKGVRGGRLRKRRRIKRERSG